MYTHTQLARWPIQMSRNENASAASVFWLILQSVYHVRKDVSCFFMCLPTCRGRPLEGEGHLLRTSERTVERELGWKDAMCMKAVDVTRKGALFLCESW